MTNFERLIELIEEKTHGGYMAAEMTTESYTEHYFRRGAGAHNIYSVSKCITGCAVGILEKEKKLSDNDTVYSYISHLFPEKFDPKWKDVRLCDVMHHRTGVPKEANIDIDTMDFWADGHSDFLSYMLSFPIISEPGKGEFTYCDTNYYLIARIVEEITGVTCAEFLQEKMFNPLKWRGHSWGCCPQNHTLGGTGIFATARDLCAYGMMLARGGEYDGEQILTPEWIEKAKGERGEYGYGFNNSDCGRWFMACGMYGQGVFIFPERKTSFVVLGHFMPLDEIREEIVPLYLD